MGDEEFTMSRAEIMDGFTAVMAAIERLDARITTEIGGLRTEMRAGFAQVDRRLARLDDRVSALEDDVSQLKSDMSRVDCRLSRMDHRLSRVETHLGIAD